MIDLAALPLGDHRLAHDCKPNSRTKPLHVKVDSAGYVYTCHRCNESGGSRSHATVRKLNVNTASEPRQYTTLSQFGRDLWDGCKAIGGAAREYLEARGCAIPPIDGDLRCHDQLRHPSGHEGPAVVALVTSAATGLPLSLHRTWIRPDGKKADVEPPRLLLKNHRKQGGVIRLWPDEAVTRGLALAEGIETALSVAHAHKPIWAAIDASNLAAFPVLAGIEHLTIFADADPAGRSAADSCADRWAAHAQVTICDPDRDRTDFNDLVQS